MTLLSHVYATTTPAGRAAIVALLKHEQYDERQLAGDGHGGRFEAGHRQGWNDSRRDLIAQLSQGDVGRGLVELRDAEAVVTDRRAKDALVGGGE